MTQLVDALGQPVDESHGTWYEAITGVAVGGVIVGKGAFYRGDSPAVREAAGHMVPQHTDPRLVDETLRGRQAAAKAARRARLEQELDAQEAAREAEARALEQRAAAHRAREREKFLARGW